MASSEVIVHGEERMVSAGKTLGQCFDDDPILTFLMNGKTREERLAYLPEYFQVFAKAAVLNDAVITEIDDFKACTLWMPPGKSVDNWATNFQAGLLGCLWNIGFSGVWKMLVDIVGVVDPVKKAKEKKVGKFYYLFFIGTLPEHQGQGRGTKLIRHWQEKAASEGISIWLEATTVGSHELYLRLGFEDVQNFMIGEGKVTADGSYRKGGEGVSFWAMIWTPNSK